MSTETIVEKIFDINSLNNSVLNQVLARAQLDKNVEQKPFLEQMLQVFSKEVCDGNMSVSENIFNSISARITEIDEVLTEQINEIIHHPEFQALEASWRSLHQLVKAAEPNEQLKIRLLDVTKEEILLDAESASDFDQSALFKLLYEEEYGTFGGESYGLLVGNYEFSKNYEDIECLKVISTVAAASHAPFIASASPELFDLSTFKDIQKPKSLEKMFNSVEFANWNTFRSTEDAKYITLTLPRVIKRLHYGRDGIPVREFQFSEDMGAAEDDKFLWGNAAFPLAERIALSFKEYGWFQNIRGVENGGVVADLPVYHFYDLDGNKTYKAPVEVIITDRREKELDDLGLLALVYKRNSDMSVFFGSKTIHKVKEYDSDIANANAELTTHLPYLMSISRFAHYLKSIMRDKIGSFTSRQDVDRYLNKWIAKYVIVDDNASVNTKSRYPLREARVDVIDVPGKPGAYKAVMFLRPHYYLNELTISMRLVTELPSK